jgi:hypothetical protein
MLVVIMSASLWAVLLESLASTVVIKEINSTEAIIKGGDGIEGEGVLRR